MQPPLKGKENNNQKLMNWTIDSGCKFTYNIKTLVLLFKNILPTFLYSPEQPRLGEVR